MMKLLRKFSILENQDWSLWRVEHTVSKWILSPTVKRGKWADLLTFLIGILPNLLKSGSSQAWNPPLLLPNWTKTPTQKTQPFNIHKMMIFINTSNHSKAEKVVYCSPKIFKMKKANLIKLGLFMNLKNLLSKKR